jgi:putative component of toxin-antitoxin plasmid stabilization module
MARSIRDRDVIDGGPGYRIHRAQAGGRPIVRVGGGIQRGSQRDIDRAKELHA